MQRKTIDEQVPKLLMGMDTQNEQEQEPGHQENEAVGHRDTLQDIYVLVVREREEAGDAALVVDSTPLIPQKTSFLPAYAICGLYLLCMLATLTFQLYCLGNPPTVTVTIIPKIQRITLSGTLQLGRLLPPLTISQSQTTATTGIGHHDATAATGYITLYNGQFTSVTIPAGTIITSASGRAIITEQDATIPAGNPPSYGQTTVSAHAISAGARGNIPAYDMNQACCATSVLAKNREPFTGGKDERDFPTVSQQDINRVSTPLKKAVAQSMQAALQGQLTPYELVFILPCSPTVTSDHQPGQEAAAVNITLSETCSAVAYNEEALQAHATALLITRATKQIGAGYTLVGAIHVTIRLAIVVHGTLSLVFSCRGEWVYGVTNAQQQLLKRLLAGKTTQQALHTLAHLPGIVKAAIGDVDGNAKLPSNPTLIHLVMLEQPG